MSFQRHNPWTSRSDALPDSTSIDGSPLPAHTVYGNYEENNDDCEVPLDMSIKRKPPSPHHSFPSSHHSDKSHTNNHDFSSTLPPHTFSASSLTSSAVRGRPSVITSVGAWNLEAALPPPPPYNVAAAYAAKNRKANIQTNKTEAEQSLKMNLSYDDESKTNRKVVQARPVDPEIDEHFRRSLGTNYQELFATEPTKYSQPGSNDSVDDHFLKALGSTWTKLKDEERPEELLSPLSLSTRSESDTLQRTSRPWENLPSYSENRATNSDLYSHSSSPSRTPINLSNKIQKDDSMVTYSSSNITL